ncbi:MAG: aspartate aminotransferase family protein [Bacteroidota bacterium]
MSTQRQLFFQHLALTSDFPLALEISHAEGNYLIDVNGKKYLDLISGIAVSNLGHGHAKIKEAVIEQVNKNMHLMVYGEYVHSPQVKLAEKLCSLLPASLNNVYFVNSGAEAVEGALKLAKRFTGRTEIISCKNAYHGSTHGALSIIGDEEFKNAFRPLLPDVRQIVFNDFSQLEQITGKTACVIVEPVQGEAGIRPATKEYLEALRKKCTEQSVILIFDEIQSGYGRTGKLFAFEHYGVIPDVLLLAKGMGGGMPLGAFISSQEMMKTLRTNPVLGHITTFGGHPVCCAASLAALEEIVSPGIITTVTEKEKLFRQLLVHPAIREIRSKGLMMAVELESFEKVQQVITRCIEKGVIVDWFLFCNNSLRIAPPLTISEEEIRMACGVILESLN